MLKIPIYFLAFSIMFFSCNSENKSDQQVEESQVVNISDIEKGIKDHIDNSVKENGGYFNLQTDSSVMKLSLVRVHTEYLSNLGPEYHFACVDLADVHGDVYDVDFFLKGKVGEMEVTEATIHKLNGKPFYSWKQKEDKTWHMVAMEESSNELLGVIEGNDNFIFYYEVQLPEITDSANIWIPIAQSDQFQEIELISTDIPETKEFLIDEKYNNKILHIALKPEHSLKTLRLTYNVRRKEKGPYNGSDENLDMYLDSNPLIPVGGRFSTIVDQVLYNKQQDNDLVKARALYDYIIDNMLYKKAGLYGTGDANYACDSKSGNCTEFHSFFISLARTAGIPARFAIGAAIPSSRDEGGVDGYHCWAEFFAEGKWWPIDISEGNKYTALATYYFGHHPANRIELSRGRDIEVTPGPSSGPIKFLAYPLFESNSVEQKVETSFKFKREENS